MDPLLIATRAVHFAGSLSLAGVFGFVAFIAPRPSFELRRRLATLGWISLAMVALSGPLLLVFVTQSMTGDSLVATVSRGAVRLALISTQFGHAALLRGTIVVLLVPFVARLGRRPVVDLLGTLLAGTGVAAMAWQGHGGADLGWNAVIHLSADAAHLVAAGLWLGALLPLTMLLREPASPHDHYRAARRFSALGVVCVAALLVSGVINAWYLVGSPQALLGTPYGQTLLAKLAVVAAMLWLAAVNRWRLVPRLRPGGAREAAQRLARHAAIEAALGLGVIAIVAALGTMVPAAHQVDGMAMTHMKAMPVAAAR